MESGVRLRVCNKFCDSKVGLVMLKGTLEEGILKLLTINRVPLYTSFDVQDHVSLLEVVSLTLSS
jgi:hypothetical protein